MSNDLSCSCGDMVWSLSDAAPGRHIVCYCADCQGFARHLGKLDLLNAAGGTHIFQTVPEHLQIKRGAEALKVLRLSEKGL